MQDSANLLNQLKAKVAYLQQINELLKLELDPILLPHCCVANLRDNILILEIDSSAWATRLRFLAPTLLQKLRTHKPLHKLQEIQWYIRPKQTVSKSHKPLALSEDNAEFIEEVATHIENENLKIALRKLAARKR